jgi:hypothetical protein
MENKTFYLMFACIIASVLILSPLVTQTSLGAGVFSGLKVGSSTVTPDSTTGMISFVGQNGLSVVGSGSQIVISNPGTMHITENTNVNWNSGYGTSWYDDNFKMRGSSYSEVKSSEIAAGTISSITITPITNTQTGTTTITLYHNGASTGIITTIPAKSTAPITISINYDFGSGDYNNWVIKSSNPNQQSIIFNFKQNITFNN